MIQPQSPLEDVLNCEVFFTIISIKDTNHFATSADNGSNQSQFVKLTVIIDRVYWEDIWQRTAHTRTVWRKQKRWRSDSGIVRTAIHQGELHSVRELNSKRWWWRRHTGSEPFASGRSPPQQCGARKIISGWIISAARRGEASANGKYLMNNPAGRRLDREGRRAGAVDLRGAKRTRSVTRCVRRRDIVVDVS